MEKQTYEKFKEHVLKSSGKDPIYYAGYLWLDLDDKQDLDVAVILYKYKHAKAQKFDDDKIQIFTPSGFGIVVNERAFINACIQESIDKYFKLP